MDDNILLVLGLHEGRRFPKRSSHQLVIEAKFDGEVLNTDLVNHESSPQFHTELAWEIDKKSLHQHRLQRTPIKLQVFAVDKSSKSKELVGYCVLDLRTAQLQKKKKASWQLLLNPKYQNMKPEIKVNLVIENDTKNKNEEGKTAMKDGSKVLSPKLPVDENEAQLDVVLNEEQGYYLIGPENGNCVIFSLAICIGGPRNLVKLMPADPEFQVEDGFYFYYSLFDNDVTNETFYDLINPSISTERATVRICTTPSRLREYLMRKKHVEILLCSSSFVLGKALVSLDKLCSVDFEKTPATVEGLFPLMKNNEVGDTDTGVVGVSIVLKKEETEKTLPKEPDLSPVVNKAPQTLPGNVDFKRTIPRTDRGAHDNLKNVMMKHQDVNSKVKTPDKHKERNVNIKLAAIPRAEVKHHIVYSIDLRSISNMKLTNPIHAVCRYNYPFFGSSAPVITNPPVYIQRNSEVLLPSSFCKFEFASTVDLLQSTLTRVPLIIEVWNKSETMKDELLGVGQVQLSNVLLTEKKPGSPVQIRSERIPITSYERASQQIGEIHVVLGLEDRGEIIKPMSAVEKHIQPLSESEATFDDLTTKTQSNSASQTAQPRETQEYQVAMALELWRQQQEEHFQHELANKENELMTTLADEWKKRDMEREVLLKKKLEEYNLLEKKLQQSLQDLDKREKFIISKEDELAKTQQSLQQEFERKTIEMREASRLLKQEYEHQLNLEKRKTNDTEERLNRTLKQLYEIEEKLKLRENEIYSLKESMLSRPEVKLQSEMNLLILEKNELERKLESATKSKIHYKQQWGRALRELARVKVTEQEAAKHRLKKQQQELDHMKLRYLAAEEKGVMKSEREEIEEVKNEINKKLEEIVSTRDVENHAKQQENTKIDTKPTENLEPDKSRIAKLIEERDILLQTGVYSLDDRVITELDKEIQNLISHNVL